MRGQLQSWIALNSTEVSAQLRQLLDRHGTSFRKVLAGVRKKAAQRYLRQGLNITQITLLLGFADATSFQHAFRRWFNVSAAAIVLGQVISRC
jgi:AraC-like DNA-binding protein